MYYGYSDTAAITPFLAYSNSTYCNYSLKPVSCSIHYVFSVDITVSDTVYRRIAAVRTSQQADSQRGARSAVFRPTGSGPLKRARSYESNG